MTIRRVTGWEVCCDACGGLLPESLYETAEEARQAADVFRWAHDDRGNYYHRSCALYIARERPDDYEDIYLSVVEALDNAGVSAEREAAQ